MHRLVTALLVCGVPSLVLAQAPSTERWVVTTDLWGNALYQGLTWERTGKRLGGELDGDALEGERTGNDVRFVVTDAQHARATYTGKVSGDTLRGTADLPDSNHPNVRVKHAFSARRVPERPAGPPRTHDFKPTTYSNEFSASREPVLTLWAGDTLHTTTLDSGGVDEHGVTQALFGNPQTGPFFIGDARPGDTLVIHLKRLKLNRRFADSLDTVVGRALTPALAAKAADLGKPVRWKLDLERGVASPETPTERLKAFTVPLRPMLGGLAVAPGFGLPAFSTGDTSRFGGNMDFNEVVEGNTVYLPVFQPGALLYLGDGHAAQGDGETSQYALETSMEVELTVDVVHGKAASMPRVESPTHLMVLGQAGSLDDALRAATSGLTQWLEQDYGLTLSESAQVLGSSAQYVVANLAGRSVGVVAKLDKARLATLKPVAK
ncbi:acetamidase [Corallococcus sp. H22C18031201]|uniref:acetamidase/formamidase family protein n=1 Tax=Citreicoccus inhibens TaxID=2849499 RepID=UPI000E72A9BC|nr:acetamidase/formamidase family protein [Citreicoccus inhibens]MBU8896511.1 acetamidase/formamidase family protein [Citreicoccus inhibens]RJS18847.1 acetamidase [Corallococcus sp. H22C18031201]